MSKFQGRIDLALRSFSHREAIIYVPPIFITVCVLTRLWTGFRWKATKPDSGQQPPVAPYWLPYLQHLLSFLSDPNRTFQRWKQQYPDTPFTLMMMGTKFHVFDSAATASHIFTRSRDFVFEPVVASMMENGLDLPQEDRPKFQLPLKPASMLSKEEMGSREFLQANHAVYLKYLTSSTLDDVMRIYVEKFHIVLSELFNVNDGNSITVNYHELMRKTIFEASAVTFFGTRLAEYWPNMWEDWKAFNDASFAGVRSNLSFYLRPRALLARSRMLAAFEKWCDCDLEEWQATEGIWNSKWGIKMNWEREALGRKYGFSHRGRACIQASFLFVIVTNSAPMATWFTLCILRAKGGIERYRQEIEPLAIADDKTEETTPSFDVSTLKKNAYVQGIWKEALRTGTASAAARVVVKEAEIDGFVVKPGSVLMIPVQLLHFDTDIFPQPEVIDPERWILGDENDETMVARLQKQNSNLRSFGGGTGLCSGRFVAEQEIISVVSTVLLLFDIDFLTPVQNVQLNPRSIGVMSPKQDPIARLRRRRPASDELKTR